MAREIRTTRPRLGASVSAWVARGSERVDNFRTPLGLAVLAMVAFLGYTAFQATTGPPFLPKYRITVKVPNDAPSLRKGQAVRVGGSLAGLIQKVEPDPENDQTLVEVSISKGKYKPLPKDTTAFVRVKSIVYVTYLALTPGTSKEMLKDGDTLTAEATSGTDLLEVVELFDRTARENLSKTLVNVGFGVAGRGTELNGALRDLPATSSYLRDQLRAATSTPGALGGVVQGAANTSRGLKGRAADDVAGLITGASRTVGATARKREALGRTIDLLRPFADEVVRTEPAAVKTLDALSDSADALEPAVDNLTAQLPGLTRLSGQGDVLRNSIAALLTAGSRTSDVVRTADGIVEKVLISGRPVVRDLFGIQTTLGPLNRSLDQLLATIDPYLPEVTQAGLFLQEASKTRLNAGLNPGAPVLRLQPILSPLPCRNPIPKPGQAQQDGLNGDCK